jgi:nicotinamide riboside transporter PnuC
MWEARHRKDTNDEEYELLPTPETTRNKDGDDGDTRTITSVNLRTESYQSTSRLIVYVFTIITALMLIFTCATFGSSVASNRKAKFHIDGIMPSVNLASGQCETLKYVNLSLHLIINCIGTVIIGCSNYLQQSNSFSVYR